MTQKEQNEYLEFAKKLSKDAGKIMNEYFNKDKAYSYKTDKTIVTEVDKKINTFIINEIKKKYPTHAIDGEEEKYGKSAYTWICDPIDGTAMYARKIPISVFSLALAEEGVPILGVVYDPFTDNLYSAFKGNGAYENNTPIKVNNYELENENSIINFDIWPAAEYNLYPILEILGKKTYTVSIGSIIRAGVEIAKGNFTLALFPGTKDKNCDIAALKVIVEEAGGKVTNLAGEEERYDQSIHGAIISNKLIHEEIVKLIKEKVKLD